MKHYEVIPLTKDTKFMRQYAVATLKLLYIMHIIIGNMIG